MGRRPGAFSTGTLLPAFRAAGFDRFVAVASASGPVRPAGRGAERLRESGSRAPTRSSATRTSRSSSIATPHDTHADLAARALAAGRHVWCEKPLALTLDELDAVREGLAGVRAPARRRLQPALVPGRAGRAAGAGRGPGAQARGVPGRGRAGPGWPLVSRPAARAAGCWARCATSSTPRRRWSARPVEDVTALAGRRFRERPPGDDAAVSLRFADGSLAAIAYGSAEPVAGKEWIEVQAGVAPGRHRRLPVGRGGR